MNMKFYNMTWFRKCEIVHVSSFFITIIHLSPAFKKLIAINYNISCHHAMCFTCISYKSLLPFRINIKSYINAGRPMFEYIQTGHII